VHRARGAELFGSGSVFELPGAFDTLREQFGGQRQSRAGERVAERRRGECGSPGGMDGGDGDAREEMLYIPSDISTRHCFNPHLRRPPFLSLSLSLPPAPPSQPSTHPLTNLTGKKTKSSRHSSPPYATARRSAACACRSRTPARTSSG
jgi:hypothetical protein